MDKSKWGVHVSHCCVLHGCKYGDKDCPVVTGEVEQEYLCESCGVEGLETLNDLTRQNDWVRINLRMKKPCLPTLKKRVLFAQYSKIYNAFHQFIGELVQSNDIYYVFDGIKNQKVTSEFWWRDLPKNPKI